LRRRASNGVSRARQARAAIGKEIEGTAARSSTTEAAAPASRSDGRSPRSSSIEEFRYRRGPHRATTQAVPRKDDGKVKKISRRKNRGRNDPRSRSSTGGPLCGCNGSNLRRPSKEIVVAMAGPDRAAIAAGGDWAVVQACLTRAGAGEGLRPERLLTLTWWRSCASPSGSKEVTLGDAFSRGGGAALQSLARRESEGRGA